MKKLISTLLVLAMVLAMPLSAFAAPITTDGASGNVALNGNVSATASLVSVTLPTSIAFQVTAVSGVYGSFTSGTGTITNNLNSGTVKIYLDTVSESVTTDAATVGTFNGFLATASPLTLKLGTSAAAAQTLNSFTASATPLCSITANSTNNASETITVFGTDGSGGTANNTYYADTNASTITTVLRVSNT